MAENNENSDNKTQSDVGDTSERNAELSRINESYKSGQGVFQEPVGSIEDNPFSPEDSLPDTEHPEPKNPQSNGDSDSES